METMAETEPKIIRAQKIVEVPTVKLPFAEHEGRNLIFHRFGLGSYRSNVAAMPQKRYRSAQFPKIAFTPATTSQSISIATDDVDRTKAEILDPNWLQLGLYVKASEGVFLNPPKDERGQVILDEDTLNSYLIGTEKVNGIYVVKNNDRFRDFVFVPADTYKLREQDHRTFLKGGLARGFEHCSGQSAERLPAIANAELYPKGVYVSDAYKPTNQKGKTEQLVASLYSSRAVRGDRLYVYGYWDGYGDGYAFGVFDTGEASAPKNK